MHFLPEGTPFVPDHQFPATKADYDQLKALKDSQLEEIVPYITENPKNLVGYELKYKKGPIITVGNLNAKKIPSTKFDRKVVSIKITGILDAG